ncbi:MAG: aspartoacylase [Fibrobacter sp.]|jgi:aspartoacylase/N-acyl-aromatic-L-amino acid amidohydrolase|nr:aspartoacylase [Fibrobacter sp.]
MQVLKNILIVGGTHGNELTGVKLIEKWEKRSEKIRDLCPSAQVKLLLANPKAVLLGRRYKDRDLNRSFSEDSLASAESLYETQRAQEINTLYGEKGEKTKTDFIFDIHNTESNMGFCLILSARDPFAMRASAELTHEFPKTRIYFQPEPRAASPYLGTIAKADICLETGPQSHGTIQAEIFETTEKILRRYLELAELWNQGTLQSMPLRKVDVYTQFRDVDFIRDAAGSIRTMIHPALQNRDFEELRPGMPLFRTFDGEDIPYEGAQSVFPIFINEAAYYEKGIAMSLTLKTEELW